MEVRILFRLIQFLSSVLFQAQDPIQDTTLHLAAKSPWAPLGGGTVSDFACFSWPQRFWGLLLRCSVDRPSVGICRIFFSWSHLSHVFWVTAEVKCHSDPSHQGCTYIIKMTCQCWHYLWSPNFCSACQVFHCKVTLSFSLTVCILWKRVATYSPCLGGCAKPPLG